jgi:cytochrome P450
LYEYVRNYQADQFIQHDRPEHLEMRKVVHSYFTPRSMEAWRGFVKDAVKELLDAAEAKGRMDVMKDLATPLPVLAIAQMMGVPKEDRAHVRHLAELLLNIGRGEADRMKPLVEGMQGMIDYVSPLVDERIVKPGNDFISVLADGEKRGIFTRHQVLVNTSLLLLAGHETTINLLCNGTWLSSAIRISGKCSKMTRRPGQAGHRGVPAVRCSGQIYPAPRLAGRGDARQNPAQGRPHPVVHYLGESGSRGVYAGGHI